MDRVNTEKLKMCSKTSINFGKNTGSLNFFEIFMCYSRNLFLRKISTPIFGKIHFVLEFLVRILGPNFGTEFQVLIWGPNFGGSNFSPSEAEIETPHRRDGSMDDIFIIVKIG